jgi:gamma-glutamyltranspeptidase/glutathione hydrolase
MTKNDCRGRSREHDPLLERGQPGTRDSAKAEQTPAVSRRELLAGTAAITGGGAVALSGFGAPALAQRGTPTTPASISLPLPGDHVQAVVTAHELATNAGFEMLQAGGTAADAAVAVAAVLTVVESWFSSVFGGDTWGLYYDAATQQVTSLDGVGPVGRNVDVADYAERADQPGIHQAIVPGAWDGWMLWLDRYGRLDLGLVLNPAIRIAREGFPASESMVFWLEMLEDDVLALPTAARIYAPDGELPKSGDIIRQPDLADTFEAVVRAHAEASGGSRSDAIQAARDYFYRGPLAEAIVAFSDENNGYLVIEDFNEFEAAIVDAISINYTDDIAVYQNPPNSQGIAMLLALNILKGIDFSGKNIDDPDVVHAQVEAIKLAFADRYAYIGDPARVEIPLEDLLSDEYASAQRARIDMEKAMEWPIEAGMDGAGLSNTSTFHIVDVEGNACGVTTSLGAQFLVIGDTGIHINGRMSFLSLEEGNPNQMIPGFKVRHTSCPYMALRDERPYITGGNTGVDTQPQAQMQQFLNVVDFGLTAQRSIDRPRFVSTSFPATNHPFEIENVLQMENGFPDALIKTLEEWGHEVVVGEGIVGTAGMIVINDDGSNAEVGVESRSQTSSGGVVPAV